MTDSDNARAAIPLAPYEREPSQAAPSLRSASSSSGVVQAHVGHVGPRGPTPVLQALQTRLTAALKPGGRSGDISRTVSGGGGRGRSRVGSSAGEEDRRR